MLKFPQSMLDHGSHFAEPTYLPTSPRVIYARSLYLRQQRPSNSFDGEQLSEHLAAWGQEYIDHTDAMLGIIRSGL